MKLLSGFKKLSETIKSTTVGKTSKTLKPKANREVEVTKSQRVRKLKGSTLTSKNRILYCELHDDVLHIHEGVVRIAPCAFMDDENVERIVFPKSLREISYAAFQRCKNLREVCFTDDSADGEEINIGAYAFAETEIKRLELKKVKLGKSVFEDSALRYCTIEETEEIPNAAFKNTQIRSFKIPEGTKKIGAEAFKESDIEIVKMCSTIEYIGDGAFSDCKTLKRIDALETTKIDTITEEMFFGCTNLQMLKIPETVRTVEKKAFCNCKSLKDFNMSVIKELSDYCFAGSGLVRASLWQVNTIPDGAFYSCKNLRKLEYTDNVLFIGKEAFARDIKLEKIFLANVNVIGESAFKSCIELSHVAIGASLVEFGKSAFQECIQLQTVEIESCDLNEIPTSLFEDCIELVGVYINETTGIQSIGNLAFKNCVKLEKIVKFSPIEVGELAFFNCLQLKMFDLGKRVTKIASKAFAKTGLEEVKIPATIEVLGTEAFAACPNLQNVEFEANISDPSFNSNVFKNCKKLEKLIFPKMTKKL